MVFAVVSALVLGACGTSTGAGSKRNDGPWVAGVGGSIVLGIPRAPTGCNPNTPDGATWANQLVLDAVLPSAFFVNPSGQSVYDQSVIDSAELQNVSPQTIVYTIDPKATWSDGVPLTSADFIYAWQQQRGSFGSGPAATTAGYRDIQSVTGSNNGKTVTVVFKTPYADWQRLFAYLLPAHVLERTGWNPSCTTVDPAIDLSAGPFVIEQVVPGKEIDLVRNPKWWGTKPNLDRLVIRVGSGAAQLAGWLGTGRAQVVLPAGFDAGFLNGVASQPRSDSSSDISFTILQLAFSTTGLATADVRVRTALAHAIDRQALVNQEAGWADTSIAPAASHFYSQAQTTYPTPKPAPPQIASQPDYSPPPTSNVPTAAQPFPTTADLAATTRGLTAAGYTIGPDGRWISATGQVLQLRLAVDTEDAWAVRAAGSIAYQLDGAGIGLTLVPEPDLNAAGMALASGAADLALLPYQASPYPTQALAWFTPSLGLAGQGGSEDWTGFDDPELNQLLTKAAQELNPDTAQPLYTEADALLWTQMVALPLFAEPTALAWSRSTTGITANPAGPGLLWNPESWAIVVPPSSPNTASTSSTTTQ